MDKEKKQAPKKEVKQEKEEVKVEPQLSDLILSLDPGFVKCGIVVMNRDLRIVFAEQFQFVDQQKDKKKSQVEQTLEIHRSVHQKLKELFEGFDIKVVVIEQQIGKFASTFIQNLLIIECSQYLSGKQIQTISPKFKLQVKFGTVEIAAEEQKGVEPYKINKKMALGQLKLFLEQTNQKCDICFDIADAVLQCIYFIKNRLK